jgi:hypothetical protein
MEGAEKRCHCSLSRSISRELVCVRHSLIVSKKEMIVSKETHKYT